MNEQQYEYVKADIAIEVDYPASGGINPPETPKSAYVSYVVDTPGAKPGEDGLYDGFEVASVPASSREVVEWQGAYRRFDERVQMAHLKLQETEALWLQAMEDWKVEMLAAVAEYAPVHEEIEARKAMVEAQDVYLEELRAKGEKVVKEAAREAEDAVYGPRHWVLYRIGPKGDRKTLHHVRCGRYTGAKTLVNFSDPIRVVEARAALLQPNVKACEACKAEGHINQAEKARMNARIPQQRQG